MAGAEAVRFRGPRVAAVLLGLGAAGVVAWLLSVRFGEVPLSLVDALREPDSGAGSILRLRISHAALAVLVGAALGGSGCALQGVLRNPLADPFVLGVSGGAALGATLALALGAGLWGAQFSAFIGASVPAAAAFAGALAATGLVFAVGASGGSRTPHAALLSGVIFNAFAAAAITCVKTMAPPDRLGGILHWLAGSLGYEKPSTLALTGAVQVLALGGLWALSGRLNLLSLGDEDAASLGVPVARTRAWVLMLASLSVAAAVALSGLIGFVGLVVPHLLRLILGPDQRLLLPASVLGGSGFLLLADVLARLLFRTFHEVLPVGVLTALLGGPFFLLLLHQESRAGAVR